MLLINVSAAEVSEPLAAGLLIPATAALVQEKLVPGVALVAV